ncbi:carbohydrate-binding module family 32 [Cadophora sp. DSE1049]|nr:carbohydrate-binding module family 32 [Cadophora sp. DSE1049]
MLQTCVSYALLLLGIWGEVCNALSIPFVAPSADVLKAEGLKPQEVTFAAPADGTLIPQTGWTVAVDSFQPNAPGVNAIDRGPNTFWHTEWSPINAPLPHTFTIDMQATYNVDGIGYLPRQDGNSNGNIGSHQIFVSTDNVTWVLVAFGMYYDDSTQKYTSFETIPARYIQIKALSEAGNRGPWTTAAEFTVFAASSYTPPSPNQGKWSATIDFPLVPVSAALHPNGKVLVWSSYTSSDFIGGNGGQTLTSTFDPAANTVTERLVTNTGHDMFCPGISLDVNGRVIVTGGNASPKTSIRDPTADNWVTGAQLKIPRGYHASTACSDGRIFTIGGSWSGGEGGKNGEIYDPKSNAWSLLPGCPVAPMLTADTAGVYRQDNHGWLFGWKNQYVFQAGPSKAMNWYNTASSGAQNGAGNRASDGDSMCGNAIMYDASSGKILTIGGSPNYSNSPSKSNAYIITLGADGANPVVTTIGNMNYPRTFANAVVLPSGQVFIAGGQNNAQPFSDVGSQLTPELWDPNTNAFTTMTPNTIPRNYHSIGLLLTDGTVLVGGGGLCGTCSTNHFDAQIFTPPYLLNADGSPAPRPSITSVSATVFTPGSRLTIKTNVPVTLAALVRLGTTTHTVNTDQRRISLTLSGGAGNTYTASVPNDFGITLPGFWMLFVLNANKTPSLATMVQVKK